MERVIAIEDGIKKYDERLSIAANFIVNNGGLVNTIYKLKNLLKDNGIKDLYIKVNKKFSIPASCDLNQLNIYEKNHRIDFIKEENLDVSNKLEIERITYHDTSEEYIGYQRNEKLQSKLKVIAFYLPQFHPFKENDAWWGKGFTEWTNVGKALPNYEGHYQPHCPIHFGYYDLRIQDVMIEQAKVAKNYGITAFSYYFYWFDGTVLMETPLQNMLDNKDIDIEFCLTWANENWSRRWDGQENDILISQKHSEEDSEKFIRYLIKYFKDPRYIKIDGKPILIIYRINIIPNIKITIDIWNNILKSEGFDGLYLICAQTFGIKDPNEFYCNAAVEFPPHTIISGEINNSLKIVNHNFSGKIYSYEQIVENAVIMEEPEYKKYRTAMLSWDNTARKQNNSHIMHGFSIQRYKQWLENIISNVFSNSKYGENEKLIFINAWNEWAEGTHLEPDRRYGFQYLKSTYDVIKNYAINNYLSPEAFKKKNEIAIVIHLHYIDVWDEVKSNISDALKKIKCDIHVSVTNIQAYLLVKKDFPGANIMLVENRGRDIYPFIKILKFIISLDYKILCKIHGKKSVYRNDGDVIRGELIKGLIGTHASVEELINAFNENPKLGLMLPRKYLLNHTDLNMTFDHKLVGELSNQLEIIFSYDQFPAGSMYWVRPQAIIQLLKLSSGKNFELESGLVDGTAAHGVERLIANLVKSNGYQVLGYEIIEKELL